MQKKLQLFIITVATISFSILGEWLLDSLSFLGQFDRSIFDFDLTDLYYSNYSNSKEVVPDENIVLVNIGKLSRSEIADQLNIINKYQPKTVGLYVRFLDKQDSVLDLKLANALRNTDNLVMVGNPRYDSLGNLEFIATSHPMFTEHSTIGITHLDGNNITGVLRSYKVFEKWNDKTYYNFAALLAQHYDLSSFEDLIVRKNKKELINYKGNINNSYNGDVNKYSTLEIEDVFKENFEPEKIKSKIVIFCYLGDNLADKYTIENKYYSPLNENLFEKNFPDMYGGVIFANIISNILDRDFIFHKTFIDWVILIIVGILLALIFRFIYMKFERHYHLTSKIMAIFFFNLVILLSLSAFGYFRVKIDISYLLLYILFIPDATEMILKWLKKGQNTI
ncbi:MAG: CHASE2 domain-containing protein [Bacteroidota bacterium]